MLPKYLKIHGYRSYIDEVIHFDQFGKLFCIVGENGAGKSSIIDMITTALYNKSPSLEGTNTTLDDLINSSCDYFELEFCFEMSGHEYLIKTKKKREKSRELEFFIDKISQTEKVVETQKKILDTIKLDYDVFLDTICIGQGNSAHFMNKTPNERKETLAQILDLKRYEQYEKSAKEKRKNINVLIEKLNDEISFITSRLPDVISLEDEINYLNEQNRILRSDLDDCQKEYDELVKQKQEYDAIKEKNTLILSHRSQFERNLRNINQNKVSIENQLANIIIEDIDYEYKLSELDKEIEDCREQIFSIKNDMTQLNTENDFYKNELNKIKTKYDRLDKYNESTCEFCGNTITLEHKAYHLNELKNQYDDITRKININNEKLNQLKSQGQVISRTGKEKSQDRDVIKKQYRINEDNKKQMQTLKQQLLTYNEQYEIIKKQYKENLHIVITPLEDKKFNISDLKYKCDNYQRKIASNDNTISVKQFEINKAKQEQKKLDDLKKQLNAQEILYNDYSEVVTAFGKNGIQKSIIKNDLPLLEKNINDVLSIISDNGMSIEFITNKQNKKTVMETFDIIVNDGNASRSYDTYSGGERFRLDFACHIGLARFLTNRVGANIEFFVIDEGLGSQDSFARQKFIEMLHRISGIFKQVMCITHISELQDSFNSKILIEKDNLEGSKVVML